MGARLFVSSGALATQSNVFKLLYCYCYSFLHLRAYRGEGSFSMLLGNSSVIAWRWSPGVSFSVVQTSLILVCVSACVCVAWAHCMCVRVCVFYYDDGSSSSSLLGLRKF